MAAAAAGFLRVVVLGVELCRGYGGLARRAFPSARWADYSGAIGIGEGTPPPSPLGGILGVSLFDLLACTRLVSVKYS